MAFGDRLVASAVAVTVGDRLMYVLGVPTRDWCTRTGPGAPWHPDRSAKAKIGLMREVYDKLGKQEGWERLRGRLITTHGIYRVLRNAEFMMRYPGWAIVNGYTDRPWPSPEVQDMMALPSLDEKITRLVERFPAIKWDMPHEYWPGEDGAARREAVVRLRRTARLAQPTDLAGAAARVAPSRPESMILALENLRGRFTSKELYQKYCDTARASGDRPLHAVPFGMALRGLGWRKGKSGSVRYWDSPKGEQ